MDHISVNIPSLAAVPFLSLTLKQAGVRTTWHRPPVLVCYIADWEGGPGFENHSWQAKLKRTSNIPHLWTCLSASPGYLHGIRAGACQSCTPETTVWGDNGPTHIQVQEFPLSPLQNQSQKCSWEHRLVAQLPAPRAAKRVPRNKPPGTIVQMCLAHGCRWQKALVYHPAGRGNFL